MQIFLGKREEKGEPLSKYQIDSDWGGWGTTWLMQKKMSFEPVIVFHLGGVAFFLPDMTNMCGANNTLVYVQSNSYCGSTERQCTLL